MAITFDTLKFVEKLKMAGVPEPQAKAICEAQSEVFSEVTESTLATKADVFAVKADVFAVKEDVVALKADVVALKESTKADIFAVKADISALKESTKADIFAVKADISALKESTKADIFAVKEEVQQVKMEVVEVKSRLRVTEWMVGFIVAGVSALILKTFF